MSQQPRRRFATKRACIAAMLLLAGGAIVNVAVAWGLSHWALRSVRIAHHVKDLPDEEELSRFWDAESPPFITGDPVLVSGVTTGSVLVTTIVGCGIHARKLQFPIKPGTPWRSADVVTVSSGWPVHSLVGHRWKATQLTNGSLVETSHDRWSFARDAAWTFGGTDIWAFHFRARLIPLKPIWPGFAINTAFYAFILWLLLIAPFALRRHRRIRRGLCPKCAYPIGASEVCTECGAAIAIQPRRGAGM